MSLSLPADRLADPLAGTIANGPAVPARASLPAPAGSGRSGALARLAGGLAALATALSFGIATAAPARADSDQALIGTLLTLGAIGIIANNHDHDRDRPRYRRAPPPPQWGPPPRQWRRHPPPEWGPPPRQWDQPGGYRDDGGWNGHHRRPPPPPPGW